MARALIALVLLGLVIVALCPPSVAHAAFGPPQTIDRGDPDRPIVLAANDRGDRVLVYSVGEVRRVVFAAAGRRFGRSHDLPVAPDGDEFRVAVGPKGDALIVWTYYDNSIAPADIDIDDEGCCHGVKAVVVPAGRAPGPVKTLWPKGTEVAVGGMGIRDTRRFGVAANVSVLPEGGTGFARPAGVQARFSTPRGSWGAVETVAREEVGGSAFALTGSDARLLYRRARTVVERTRDRRGRWSRERRLLNGVPEFGSELDFAADARGGLIAAWRVESEGKATLRVAAGAPGRRPIVQVVERAADPSRFFDPIITAADNGAAIVLWQIGNRVYRSERLAGGRFSPRRLAYTHDDENVFTRKAVSASGRWVSSFVSAAQTATDPIRLQLFTARFGSRVRGPLVVETADSVFATSPVIDRQGRITLAYGDGSSVRVRVGR